MRGALGLLLVAAFFGLSLTNPGLRVTFQPPWSHSSSGELYLWLGQASEPWRILPAESSQAEVPVRPPSTPSTQEDPQ